MMPRQVGDIEYVLVPGSGRKTTDIVIERDGKVVVRPPENYTPEQADAVVHSKRMWIYRNLAEWRDPTSRIFCSEGRGRGGWYQSKRYGLSLGQLWQKRHSELPLEVHDGSAEDY